MAVFEIQGPDGRTYEVQAPSQAEALTAFETFQRRNQTDNSVSQQTGYITIETPDGRKVRLPKGMSRADMAAALNKLPQEPLSEAEKARLRAELRRRKALGGQQPNADPAHSTNMLEQSMSGVNEGIANFAGLPVDMMTGALNLGAKGINAVAGTDIQPITDPVGGSASLRDALAPTISDTPPQNAGQRYGRRIGQEVGAMAIPGGAMMRSAASPLTVAAGSGASAVGAGVGGQTSREIAPDSDTADIIASMLGGMSPVAASRAMRPSPKAPTLDELKARRDAGYDAVRDSGATLTPNAADNLATGIEGTMGPRKATRMLNPKAAVASKAIADDFRAQPPSISEVDDARQWIGQNVAGSSEAGERRIGQMMKGQIDDYLDGLQPGDVTGTNRTSEVVDALTNARDKAHRIHKTQIFEAEDVGLIDQGLRRAAGSGTGGNQINAIRQNVARVLRTPKLRRGFSEEELQAMRDIADGTPTQNAMRLLGRLAPTSGAFPLTAGAGGAGFAASTGNPLFMAPSAIGFAAKSLGERSTRNQVNRLGDLIRNGGPLPRKATSDFESQIIEALLASQAASERPEDEGGVVSALTR